MFVPFLRGVIKITTHETYGCTCDAPACGACESRFHQNCRYTPACKFGQPVEQETVQSATTTPVDANAS